MRPTLEDQKAREDSFRIEATKLREKLNSEKTASNRPSGVAATHQESVIVATANAITALVDRHEAGKASSGNPGIAVQYLQRLDPTATAMLTARVAYDAAGTGSGLTRASLKLAGMLEDHYLFDQMEQEAGGLVHVIQEKQRTRPAGKHKAFIMRGAAKFVTSVTGLQWGEGHKVKLGTKLLEIFESATGMIDIPNLPIGPRKTQRTVTFTERTAAQIKEFDEDNILRATDHRATIIPPKDWVSPTVGGYYAEETSAVLVRRVSKGAKDDLFSTDLTDVYAALNNVQSTPWRINKEMHRVMSECVATGSRIGGLPNPEFDPLPARPVGIDPTTRFADLSDADRERMKTWKQAAASTHADNYMNASRYRSVKTQCEVAKELSQWERVWFPHNLDFRGRMYPIPPSLNPQSDDNGKALLEFADGKRLGENGAYWLAVHIANLFGQDKVSFDERVAWVLENSADIMDSAADPLDGRRFWTTADKPWCALAACFEYLGYMVEGQDYVSHLPIAMDGSCSGLQHFSALLRDDVGAKAVNLTNQDTPADIYTEVLEAVRTKLLATTDGCAAAWLPILSRKIVKRPCMTFAYSVTERGITDQIRDELRREYGERAVPGFENNESAKYLTPYVDAAIREVVVKAAEGMDWLKAAAKLVTASDMPILWSTPIGFRVRQDKRKFTSKKHKVWFGGERIRLTLRTPTTVLDSAKQSLSISPNFIHSMDAAHLMLTTNRMVSEGITNSFAMVHDSFGVHACDVDELNYAIRDEFAKMYSGDLLADFTAEAMRGVPVEDIPPQPERGTYNLEEVRDAEFFFA